MAIHARALLLTSLAALTAAEQVSERRSGKRIVVLHLHTLAGRDVDHCRLELLGKVGKAGRGAAARDDRLHLGRLVLRHLGSGGEARRQGQRAAGEEQRRSHSISVSHVAIPLHFSGGAREPAHQVPVPIPRAQLSHGGA